MRKIYLLVQDDIRTGPFTLKELLLQPLHSESLIWVIGESEDWLSPKEISGLQSYFTQNERGELLVREGVMEELALPSFETFKIDSDSPGARLTDINPHQDILKDSSVERKLGEDDAIDTFNTNAPAAKKKITVNTITNPLSEPDEEPAGLGKNKWPVLATISLLVLLIAWSILFNGNERTKEAFLKSNATYPSAAITPANALAIDAAPTTQSEIENIAASEMPIVVPSVSAPEYQEESLSTESFLDSVNRVLDAQDQLMAAVDEVYKKSFRYPKRVANKTKLPAKSSAMGASAAKANRTTQAVNKPTIPVSQQIDLQSRYIRNGNKQNLSGGEVMVKNNSKKVLKTVSVDVYYYKKGEHLVNKETVYFSNVYPRQSLTMAIPGNQKAITARMQLGKITLYE